MRVRESIRAVGEIARRELPINLRRAHCLQLLFAFSLAFDPIASGMRAEFRLSSRIFQRTTKTFAVNVEL